MAGILCVGLPACGGGDDDDSGSTAANGDQRGPKVSSDEGSFAIYDWEPNVVPPPGVPDPTETGVSKAKAERLAATKEGTIVLQEPEPLDIPQTKFDESKGLTRKYVVLRDRPALVASDVKSATAEIDPATKQPIIGVQLTSAGQKKYENLTFKQAKRGETPPKPTPGLVGISIGPRHAIVVGNEILSIPQLGPGSYTHGIVTKFITIVGGFDEKHAQELAEAIDPG